MPSMQTRNMKNKICALNLFRICSNNILGKSYLKVSHCAGAAQKPLDHNAIM